MMHMSQIDGLLRPLTGPLTLAERLINLAADASAAGFPVAAEHLISISQIRFSIDLRNLERFPVWLNRGFPGEAE
jgi:hypothetical protein